MAATSAAHGVRAVRKVMSAPPRHWVGDGFHVFPVFANLAFSEELSPWLMFDYASPEHFGPSRGKRRGVGQHPHRGFETVTIAFQGEVEHHDSVGNRGVIGPGDIQWMTAGRGIIHEEYHSDEFSKNGGTFEMCQLWLNLPKKHKMHKPRYQGIVSDDCPVVELPGGAGTVKLIAGALNGKSGAAKTFTPVELWDVELPTKGVPVELDLPAGHNAVVFVRKGEIALGAEGEEHTIGPQGVALMERDGSLRLVAAQKNTQVLILGGEPLNEPIAARGPFVMNTHGELQQAMQDFMSGKMGR